MPGFVILLLVSGCGLFGERKPLPHRQAPPSASEALRTAMAKTATTDHPPSVDEPPTSASLGPDVPAAVVLVVLDTVRSDHLSACGYERPTSVGMAALQNWGGRFTCDAYAPATWTQPSHATFFTGAGVHEHDMHRKGVRLADSWETLAEVYDARGYQTLAVSANPTLEDSTGLLQGFQRTVRARMVAGGMRDNGTFLVVRNELSKLDADKPLFLFLNIFDAHDPYPPVPAGIPGIPARTSFSFDGPTHGRFVAGELSEDEAKTWLEEATDGYDFGIAVADRTLGRVLRLLQRQGWAGYGVRIVVTSDHGEFLGEHGRVRHDGLPYEAVVKVPFFYYDSTSDPVELPTPMPTAHTFHLLAHGTLDPDITQPVASSIRYYKDDPRYDNAVALWDSDGSKLLWRESSAQRFDLRADPAEASPLPTADHPRLAELNRHAQALLESRARAFGQEVDAELVERLRKLGYVDEPAE